MMSRQIDPKCLACSKLPVEIAKDLHGEAGDGCWAAQRCHIRRSHYRNRSDRNESRKLTRRLQPTSSAEPVMRLAVAVQSPASVILILYSEQPDNFKNDTPIHAIGAELRVGKEKLAEMETIVCVGMRGDKVTALLPKILETFTQQFAQRFNDGKSFQRFSIQVHRHIRDCPEVYQ